MEQMNARQYAAYRGVTAAAVCETLRRHTPPHGLLPGVKKAAKLGPSYLLDVEIADVTRGRLKKSPKKV